MNLKQIITEKFGSLSEEDFKYIEANDINRASQVGNNITGIYMEASVVYLGIKSISAVVKENGRRRTALAYAMIHDVAETIAKQNKGFLNCYSPESFLIIFPGKDAANNAAVKASLQIAGALYNTFREQLSSVANLEFAMGIDHGHIMGTRNSSDNGNGHLTWFGSTISKAKRISFECARPYHVGLSSIVFRNINDELKTTQRRIIGIKKTVEMWTKVSYTYDNEKKHLYQTNHKIDLEEE